MKPDLIVTQIKHCDYPIWRMKLKKHRDYFGKIIIYFNENNRFPYLDHFMQSALSDLGNIHFLDQAQIDWGSQDWRNVSTNEMLKHTDSEWIISWEQDWVSRNYEELFDLTYKATQNSDLIGWWQPNGKYIHPSWWMIRREALEKTNKDFAAHDGFDHFGWITQDAIRLGMKITKLQDLGYSCDTLDPNSTDAFHLGGVNQNYLEGLKPEYVFHRPDIFYVYNYWCRKANIVQSPLFINTSLQIEERLKEQFPTIDPEISPWREYFIC